MLTKSKKPKGRKKKEVLEISTKLLKWNKMLNADFLVVSVLTKSKINRFQITCLKHIGECETVFHPLSSPTLSMYERRWEDLWIEASSENFFRVSYQYVLHCSFPLGKGNRLTGKHSKMLSYVSLKFEMRTESLVPNCPNIRTRIKGCSESIPHAAGGWTKLCASHEAHAETMERSKNWVILKGTPRQAWHPQLSIETIV